MIFKIGVPDVPVGGFSNYMLTQQLFWFSDLDWWIIYGGEEA